LCTRNLTQLLKKRSAKKLETIHREKEVYNKPEKRIERVSSGEACERIWKFGALDLSLKK